MGGSSSPQPKRPGRRRYLQEILIVAAGVVTINLIFISRAFRETYTIDRESAAQLGAFVGGYVGAIFTLVGIILLVTNLKSQVRSSQVQHFEAKYFELIKMHRDNVAELELQAASGRRVFVLLLKELRCILEVVRPIARQASKPVSREELLHVAYYCLFFGVGPNSSRMLKQSLQSFAPSFVDAIERELNRPEVKRKFREEREFGYEPFEGHQSRLGHYYRHLYQMVRYVDDQSIDIDKYEYVKTIRAQLSTHEQALLLVNSLTPIGRNWWKRRFIVNYRLVQNIPSDFFNTSEEIDVGRLFEKDYFEWEETMPGLPRGEEARPR